MRRLQHGLGLAATVLVTVLAVSACGGSSPSAATGEISFGAIIGQSGVYGSNGPAFVAGVQLAADKVNAAGGIKAEGKTLKLKMAILDDRSDSQVAVADAIELIRDRNVKVLVGPLALAANAVAPVANQNHVINITACPCAQPANEAMYPLLFYRGPSFDYIAGVVAASVKRFYPNAKSFAFVVPNDATHQTYDKLLTTKLTAAGLTVLDFAYPPGTTDLSTVATKAAAAKPDVVYAAPSIQEAVNVMRSLDAAAVPKSVPVYSWGGDVSAQANGRPVVIIIQNAVDVVHESNPDLSAFKQALFAKNGGPIDDADLPAAQYYYFAIQMVAKAMEKANTVTDTAAIAKAMPEITLTEFGTKFQWSADTHNMSYANAIISYSGTGQATVARISP